jgi:hypothetical protein
MNLGSCSVEPRATPGLLHRELLPANCTESYSRSVTPRASPGLLHRELLLVCYTESYSRSAMLRKQSKCKLTSTVGPSGRSTPAHATSWNTRIRSGNDHGTHTARTIFAASARRSTTARTPGGKNCETRTDQETANRPTQVLDPSIPR